MDDNRHIALWDQCRQIIRDNIPAAQYDIWFKDIESLGFSDGVLRIGVPTSFYAEHIDEHYLKILKPAIRKVYGDDVKLFYHFLQVNGAPDTAVDQKSDGSSPEIRKGIADPSPANPFKPQVQGDIDTQLNPRYTFENYCGGLSNKIVRSIAEAVANDPKNLTFNPLFVFGSVGVGKTHLIQAIGIRIKERNPQSRVLYVTARLFESQYTAALARKSINSFFHFYQSIDTLIIDDIQDLAGKPSTQNTFFHIFNHLHQNNKRIIMSSDRAPVDMDGFEERMLSRFKWGMAAELQRPDLDLRRDILSLKAEQAGLDLPWDVKEYIAANVTGSVRDLEGVMASLITHATMLDCPITIELAQSIMSNLIKINRNPLNFEVIAEKVGSFYHIDPDELFGSSRKRAVSDPRQVLMYLAKKVAKMPIVDIARRLSRTHATVNYSCNTIEERMGVDAQLQADVRSLEAMLMGC